MMKLGSAVPASPAGIDLLAHLDFGIQKIKCIINLKAQDIRICIVMILNQTKKHN